MPFVFGKSIALRWTPLIQNEPTAVDSLVSARLFADAPSNAQIETPATAGFISEVVSWTADGTYTKIITFPAVANPDPHSTTEYKKYFVVINFKYEAAGATVFDTETIHLYRSDSITSKIGTTYTNVLALDPKLTDFHLNGDLTNFIEQAITDVVQFYQGQGYERRRLFDLERLNDAVTKRAAALAWIDAYTDERPSMLEKYKLRNEQYQDALKAAEPGFDADSDDSPDPNEKTGRLGVAYIIR